MKNDTPTWPRSLVWVFLLAWFQVSCVGEVAEGDCRRVKQDVDIFTEKYILPLVASKDIPKIERSVVAQLKRLRRQVRTCALPDEPDNATEWNEDHFIRLDGRLSFFEVTLGQAAEEDNPEITRILIDSPHFREAVLDLQATLKEIEK